MPTVVLNGKMNIVSTVREEGELEDGEICDDETEESVPFRRGDGNRPGGGGAPPRTRKPHQRPHNMLPHMGHQPPDFRLMMPYNLGPHGHGPFPPGHRQQCGPSGPDRPPSPLPPPLPPPPAVLGPHGEPNPRSSFWERSHGALGRFRHRSIPNGGRGAWNRGSRAPLGRYGPGESHGTKTDSPSRKQKLLGRNQTRKAAHSVSKPENSVDESFEDLLSKYKQIQLELECIRKEETMALEPKASPVREDIADKTASIAETRPVPEPAHSPEGTEETSELEKAEKKVFQAFNIKPLRQKLPTPATLDELKKKWAEKDKEGEAEKEGEEEGERTEDGAETEQKPETEAGEKTCSCCCKETDRDEKEKPKKTCLCRRESSASSEDSVVSPDKNNNMKNKMTLFSEQPVLKVEEEELSELQLRLLALQSASKKWQQKEQQVMKKSKDRITRAAQEKNSGPGLSPAPLSRQRVTTRSAAAAAAAAAVADRNRTRSKPLERDRDRNKAGPRPPDRDRERLPERDRPKQSPKPGPKGLLERGRTLGKPHLTKKIISPAWALKNWKCKEKQSDWQAQHYTGSAAKQAFRKQQLRTWKLQQQREQEEKRRQDEEERRKREDEIRRIRDLSNQDEQYNRFMKLVGGKMRTRSKSRDREHRKSTGKQGLDASGNLYQYDNYEEVAMDTDSETNSPVPSPTHNPFSGEDPGCFPQMSLYVTDSAQFALDFSHPFLPPMLSGVPPPPPPLPPPPDELEPPPKPPFADEEEEEEMLLRETCLMSMANKRVVATEEKSSSGPPSPSCQAPAGVQQPTRGNLSTVSLNTVSQPRTNKFARGHHAPRAPLMLPRHKSVVVSLNDSDDSDSDMDACSSTQPVFGGLEFMIKEARRTVEAAKPKGASGSEKENNPVRTPEALPEAKKAEYRLLKEEIASREKQKTLKDPSQSPWSSTSPAVSESVVDSSGKTTAEVKLCEAEQRLNKNRELLQRDEAVLRHLLQQELKKRESLKAAEAKVAKLREQLQASEKIVSANKTLLKKLQEQVHRVEHRVSIKKSLAVRLEQELALAQLAAGRGSKRRTDANQTLPSKLQRVDGAPRGSERHFAELIAQKQRLQQLESEYALKIQKLKEAQALRNKGTPSELPAEPPLRASTPPDPQIQIPPPSSPFPLPQPSLHDLTQDKLTLDSEDVAEADDQESEPTPAPAAAPAAAPTPAPAAAPAAAKGQRRHSLRQSSSSFTKPNLEQLSSPPAKDSSTAKPAKTSASSEFPAEMFAGLDLDTLKLRYQQQARVGELLLRELQKLGENVDHPPTGQMVSVDVDATTSQSGSIELKPVPFGPYHSPLLVFRSYRFSPYYRTKEKLSLSSVTYSNTIEPRKCFCRFDLTGTCNDDDCRWQHMRNCTLTGNQLFQDILSYNLSLISCSESSSDEDVSVATEKYIKKLFGTNKDRMGIDQKAVLLVSKVNESKRHVPPFTTCKDLRRWRPKPSAQSSLSPEDNSEHETAGGNITPGGYDDRFKTSLSAVDVCVTSEDKRYFVSETDDISNLETSVLESPRDTQLWIKLAFKYLNQNETSAAECLEAALNTLSRALESNCDNPEVWSHYLSLFSRRGSREEVQEMCEMAVEHAPDYRVWWNYLNLESSFEGKDYVCDRLLQFLLTEASSGITEKLSFQLMEALLYRVHLNLFTGRMESALAILQNALKSAHDRSIADHLTASDRALVWLSYIHLTEFDRLPSGLYDPAESGPSRLVSRESFLLPWRTPQDISTPLDILIALFQDAIHQCSDESLSQSERMLSCLPLHTNLIFLNKLLQRYDEGIALCESLLECCPESCTLRDALADLHIRKGNSDQAVSMWLHALAECPNNAEVFYHSCKFLMAQEKSSAVVPLFRGFILSLCEDEQSQQKPVDVLRNILGFPTEELLRGPIIKKELQEQLSQQTPYLHLIHCRWQRLHGSAEETVDAFERALGSAMQLGELHKLWMDYLLFSSSQQTRGPANSQSKLFSDLVQRCLSTVPSRLEVPFNPAEFWSCYRFHNKVVTLYLSCLPQAQHALVLERLRYAMPNNTELGLRLLHQEWQDGNIEHLKFQARMLSSNTPKCLANWKIAIAVERELKERSEVRLLYQQALQNLPLCAALWRDRLLFEAAEGGNSDKLRRLIDWCQQVGVSLVVGRAQGEDH
ncbi:zinc finger C3H1 domain-containing protein-like isoform X2 [Xiphias gladius]|uniref:zinc finger C3H1 domain-containing protein-like isoform X2 n=1 Tax=Xiphias gladius TaxID=8245 RepID=UPI001A98C7C5|nr:zinc finger C3H1 domain-containing protein-like isoform X2 [Xiphias gladius]